MGKRLLLMVVWLGILSLPVLVQAQAKKSTSRSGTVRKTAPARKPASRSRQARPQPKIDLAASIPALRDSILEKDVPVRNFDSIILSSRQEQRSFRSPDFDLGKTLGSTLESFLPIQFKYAILLNESVEKLSNLVLYKNIDDWYGARYRYGGKSAKGIDCSAFMQVISQYTFGWALPRTAREQYLYLQGIRKEDLQEGDFVFFNTTGGISHVGMYLSNNKFIHSSSSQGVSIGDLNSQYWSKRFIGARRMPHQSDPAGNQGGSH